MIPPQRSGTSVRNQVVVFAAQFVLALAFWSYSPLVDFVRRDLMLTAAQIGLIPLVLDASGLIGAPIGGWITDRRSSRDSFLVLVGLASLGLALMGIASVFLALLVGVGLVGLQFATVGPLTNRMLSVTAAPSRFGFVYSVKQSSVALAMATVLFIGPALASWIGWKAALLILSGLVLTAGGLLGIFAIGPSFARPVIRPPTDSRTADVIATVRTAWRSRPMRILFAVGFVFQGMQYAYMTFAIPLLVDEHRMAPAAAAMALGGTQAAAVVSRPLMGWISDRFRSRGRTAVLAFIAIFVGILLGSFGSASTPLSAIVLLAVGGAVGFSWVGVYFAQLAELSPPGQMGFTTGLALVPIKTGGIVIPVAIGMTIDTYSYRTAFVLFGLVVMLAGLGLLTVRRSGSGLADPDARTTERSEVLS